MSKLLENTTRLILEFTSCVFAACDKLNRTRNLKVLIVFDEARALLEVPEKNNAGEVSFFRNMQHALALVPAFEAARKNGVFSVFTDTTSRISNFVPSDPKDPSARVFSGKKTLYSPIYELQTFDCFVRGSPPKTINGLDQAERLIMYGVPFCPNYFETLQKNGAVVPKFFHDVRVLAESKLLSASPTNIDWSLIQSFAVLGSTAKLSPNGIPEVASQLVSSHSAHCLGVDKAGEYVTCDYPSSPIYASAANAILSRKDNFANCLVPVVNALRRGQISRGDAGELATRIILLLAIQKTIKSLDAKEQSTLEYARVVPLAKFFETLTGVHPLEKDEIKGTWKLHLGGITTSNRELLFKSGWVFWNHFIGLRYTPNTCDLLNLMYRGAAVQCMLNETSFDEIFTIYINRENVDKPDVPRTPCQHAAEELDFWRRSYVGVETIGTEQIDFDQEPGSAYHFDHNLDIRCVTFCGIQAKARRSDSAFVCNGKIRFSTAKKLTPEYIGIDVGDNPYISLFISLGKSANDPGSFGASDCGHDNNNNFNADNDDDYHNGNNGEDGQGGKANGRQDPDPRQASCVLSGLESFTFLTDSVRNALHALLNNGNDPMLEQKTKLGKEFVLKTQPLVYPTVRKDRRREKIDQ